MVVRLGRSSVIVKLAVTCVAFAVMPGVAISAVAGSPSHGAYVQTTAGASMSRLALPERAGVIRLLQVVAPAGTRLKVTGAIPGVAGVTVSLPLHSRAAAPETCSTHDGAVVCTVAEEACPMPQATWKFQVHKLSGPAGRIRVDFVVAPQHSA